jgi:hypothetical protein
VALLLFRRLFVLQRDLAMTMTKTELLRRLRNKTGHCVSSQSLIYCIEAGHVSEPPRNERGRAVYSEMHYRELAAYVKSRRERGKAAKTTAKQKSRAS